jgi:hypothetical protein
MKAILSFEMLVHMQGRIHAFWDWCCHLYSRQTILHTTMMFYGDFVKMCKDFSPKFGDKLDVAPQQRIVSHFLFHRIRLDQDLPFLTRF